MSENVPMRLAEIGEPEDVAPLVVYLLSDRARDITGQIYTAVGNKIAVWNQPQEVRAMYQTGRWTPDQIADALPGTLGQERMRGIDRLAEAARAADAGERNNT